MGYLLHVAGRMAALRARSTFESSVREHLRQAAYSHIVLSPVLHAGAAPRLHRDFADVAFDLASHARVPLAQHSIAWLLDRLTVHTPTAAATFAAATLSNVSVSSGRAQASVLPSATASPSQLLQVAVAQYVWRAALRVVNSSRTWEQWSRAGLMLRVVLQVM